MPLIRALAVALLLLAPPLHHAAQADPLFESSAVLPITLTAPFDQIRAERDKEKEYEATLRYTDPELGPMELSAKLSVRGKFRLSKEVCTNTQLWVNFKKSELDGTLFDKQDKLKLVVQCRNVSRYSEFIVRERQAYEMFAVLSDLSFDTRALEVTYVDSDSGESETQPAFFIQHHKRLAKEMDLENFDEPIAQKDRQDPTQAALVSLYMFLVSNADYSFIGSADAAAGEACCHNVKQLVDSDGTFFPIPYDFDSSGFVNPPYALPAGELGQTNINTRIYRGFCVPDDVMQATVQKFVDSRAQLEAIAMNKDELSGKSVRRAKGYLKKFYDIIEDPKKLEREVISRCRT
jgi:hypothetical protein